MSFHFSYLSSSFDDDSLRASLSLPPSCSCFYFESTEGEATVRFELDLLGCDLDVMRRVVLITLILI